MKKILIIGLALIMCMGMAFAVSAEYSSLILKANVEMPDVDVPEDPDVTIPDIEDDGPDASSNNLFVYLYYLPYKDADTPSVNSSAVGSITFSDELHAITSENQTLSGFDLNGLNEDGYDGLYLYAYTNCAIPEGKTGNISITFSSEKGWVEDDVEEGDADTVAIYFSSIVPESSIKGNILSGVNKGEDKDIIAVTNLSGEGPSLTSNTIKFSATEGTGYVPQAHLGSFTTVDWPQDTDPNTGEYTANIAITISTGE